MVDYIVLCLSYLSKEILEAKGVEFRIPAKGFNPKTGELIKDERFNYKWEGEFKNLKFLIDTKGKVFLKGSLHKFWNNGEHNYNDFNLTALIEVINELRSKFGIIPEITKIHHVEIGLNIDDLHFKTKKINEHLLFHSGQGIPIEKFKYKRHLKDSDFIIVERDKYAIKSYDKAKHCGLHGDIYRFEIKYKKAANLKVLGINTLSDLINPTKIELLKIDFLKKWNEVFLFDWTIRKDELKPKAKSKLKDWQRLNYWEELKALKESRNRNKFSTELKEYEKIVQGHSENVKVIIAESLDKKWCKVTTELIPKPNSKKVQGHTNIIGELAPISQKYCKITGIDISAQKQGSRFLRETTLFEIYKNDKFQYQELVRKFGPRSGRILNLDEELIVICKNIRNQDSNPRLATRKRVITYRNSLFPLEA